MSYAAPAMSYAAPTTYAAPQMSYAPQATYGGYPGFGAATHSPYLDTATITQQEKDATDALTGQANMQLKMLTHQYDTQKAMIEAECARNIEMAKNQFQQQCDQSLMAIQQQAGSMQAQATQYKLQMEMQQKMSTLYSGAGAGAAKGAGAGTTKPAAGAGTKTK